MRLIFLGTGTSFGIPQIGCGCRVCHSADPRDRRGRTAVVIEDGGSHLLVDTPPEVRLQLVGAGIRSVDAVLFTHDHADHTHGIDDLRALSVRRDTPLPLYGPADALERMAAKFPYIFDETVHPPPGSPKAHVAAAPLEEGTEQLIAGMPVLPLAFEHGPVRVFGYRTGPIAYLTDVKAVPPGARRALAGLRVLVLNALFRTSHPTHLSIPEAVEAAQEIGAERTYLTHLTHQTSHAELEIELPPSVRPAHDGLVVDA